MKKSVFIVIILWIVSFKTEAQQRFKAGVKAGLSTTQVAGDTYSGYDKAGFAGGVFITGILNEKWTGQFEMIYIQKGSKHNANPEKGDYSSYYLGLNYIEVPVLFQYHQKKFTYELGPGFSYLMKETELLNWQDLTGLRPFTKNEISINLGINYIIFDNLGINWRYTNSVTSIRKHASGASRWYNPGQTNSVLAFTLTYQFLGAKSD